MVPNCDHQSIGRIASVNYTRETRRMQISYLVVALMPAMALASHPSSYGKPEPYCRDTNTSVYAEVCVPGFASKVTPVTLPIKEVVDDQFCYNQVRTVCEQATRIQPREICTFTYSSKKQTLTATTTQVTFAERSETMKVTSCRASGGSSYGSSYGHNQGGEHQYCREEYQTQSYKVPLVTEPLDVPVEVAVPEPQQECVTKEVEITEVVCKDIEEERCIKLSAFKDSTVTVDQIEVTLGDPKCDQVTLTLPTKACSKPYH